MRRHVMQLGVLITAAIALYGTALFVARHVRATTRIDAMTWYARGAAALRDRRPQDAVAALRRAASLDREQRRYQLALASALQQSGQDEAAERRLLALRATAPEDSAVNLQLARLAAARADVATAVRYYRNAMYAPWTRPEEPRAIRAELIGFLLQQQDPRAALPEVVAAATNVPDTVADHVRVARWFAATGDLARAGEQYARALRLDPGDSTAREGAGRVAYRREDYPAAARLLRGIQSAEATRMREVAARVVDMDPLAPGLRVAQRRRRMAELLRELDARLAACRAAAKPPSPSAADTARSALRAAARADADDFENLLPLAGRVAAVLDASCPSESAGAEAVRRILRLHPGDRA